MIILFFFPAQTACGRTPCANGGTCINDASDATNMARSCNCPNEYKGSNCESETFFYLKSVFFDFVNILFTHFMNSLKLFIPLHSL